MGLFKALGLGKLTSPICHGNKKLNFPIATKLSEPPQKMKGGNWRAKEKGSKLGAEVWVTSALGDSGRF